MKSQLVMKAGIILLYLIFSYAVFLLPDNTIFWVTREDGLIEALNSIWLLVSAILFFIIFWKDKQGNDFFFMKTYKNLFFLLLAILFFFGSGEEISWGQRIFQWQSPAWFSLNNVQDETNIHNLAVFHGILNFEHLFTCFWITYCLIIPVLYSRSMIIATWIDRINLPVIPMWLGALFLINYVIFIILKISLWETFRHQVVEVKETCMGFLFLISSIDFIGKTAGDEIQLVLV
jgi:hypothetical protein